MKHRHLNYAGSRLPKSCEQANRNDYLRTNAYLDAGRYDGRSIYRLLGRREPSPEDSACGEADYKKRDILTSRLEGVKEWSDQPFLFYFFLSRMYLAYIAF